MAFTRIYAGLTSQQANDFAAILQRDGAVTSVSEDEGTFTLKVNYPDWMVAASPSPAPSQPSAGATSLSPSQPPPGMAVLASGPWGRLIAVLRVAQDLTPQQKIVSLSQWIVESGRGTSQLAQLHLNFGGLKFRTRMKDYATPVDYIASDGEGTYCKFTSEEAFVRGYWHFIASGPYEGWEQFKDNAAGYLRHIAPKYAADPQYVNKVLSCFTEAETLLSLQATGSQADPTLAEPKLRLAIVVGHNSVSPGAVAVSPISRSEFKFNNTVADSMVEEAQHYNIHAKRFNRVHEGGYSEEIRRVYKEVHEWSAGCAVELHFNALNAESTGTEMLFASGSIRGQALSSYLAREVEALLKLKLRHSDGLKPLQSGDRGYASVVALDIPTVLVEPFFGSNPSDVLAAATAGEAALGRAYLRAVRDWATNEGGV